MAVRAYVLFETEVEKTRQVTEAICRLKGVVSVDLVTGPYDAIAVVEGETLTDLGEFVTAKLHPLSGISRTVTCLAV